MQDLDPPLPSFDTDEMLEGLRPWIECESPTWDAAAVNNMMDLASRELAILGARIERIPGSGGFGDSVLARMPHPRQGEPGILILGHLDTVHPVGTLALLPFRRDGAICYGPGIADMKAGNFLALEALRRLANIGVPTSLPVTVLFTGDEEAGSPSTRGLIEAEARRHRIVLIPEPGRPDGSMVLGRHAITRFSLKVSGRPTHAGNTPERGVSAVREMAELIVKIEEMSTPEAVCSVGVIRGGQWSNCVPASCEAEALVISQTPEALTALVGRLQTLRASRSGATLELRPGPARPPWVPDAACLSLFGQAEAIANSIGLSFPRIVSGGGSDGNFTGALGVPTLDGLGALGELHHTLIEHIFIDSLAERGRLMAGLLTKLEPPAG